MTVRRVPANRKKRGIKPKRGADNYRHPFLAYLVSLSLSSFMK
jgi:hypothetical protein